MFELLVLHWLRNIGTDYSRWRIRIFNGREVWIENSVKRVTVRHHRLAEWCRTVILSDRIFNSHWKIIMDSFSCIPFLPQLHLSLNMCYLINFIVNISICSQELTGSAPLNDVDVKTFGRKWHQKDILMSCTRVVLHTLVEDDIC